MRCDCTAWFVSDQTDLVGNRRFSRNASHLMFLFDRMFQNNYTKPGSEYRYKMSLVMRKPDFCICENKGADQLCGNRTTDQRLCFRYTDSPITLLSKAEISSLKPSSVTVQPGLCRTWSETPKTGFLTTRLK